MTALPEQRALKRVDFPTLGRPMIPADKDMDWTPDWWDGKIELTVVKIPYNQTKKII
jgi:hypothetical protein